MMLRCSCVGVNGRRFQTELMQRLGLDHPIIVAPMGGATTVDLAVAVSEAGALGFLASAYLTPDQIREESRQLKARTSRPFGNNLFASVPPQEPVNPQAALDHIARFNAGLELPPPELPAITSDRFEEKLAAVLDGGAPVFSFTFGIPSIAAMQAIKARGVYVMGTATTVEEAIQLEKAGVDAIVAQGSEAGAHRGTFGGSFEAAMIGTMALVPQTVDAVKVPVVASGGIMDGRGIAAALALGASAVQLGTAFLTTDEAGIPEAYKEAILKAREHDTRITRAFSGRPARGILNRFMEETDGAAPQGAILPYPLQNMLTRPMRNAAAKQGRSEYLSLWAGQGVRMARRQSARDLIARLVDETDATLRRLTEAGRQTAIL
jgi:nitronate monooxygenase